MPTPRNVKEVEAFIGKINYYGKFVRNFSNKCKPLNGLRRLNAKWNWNGECQKAFDHLRHEISEATTLVHFDPTLPLILATDASNYGLGAVIMHRYSDGSERPIAHASKTLTDAEKNYSQIEKEALSIVYGIKKFHQYLAGRSFELNTDHQPLLTIFNPAKGIPVSTANRLQRWALCLMNYTYTIRYKPTKCHANADALSRLPAGPDDSFVDADALQINYIQEKLVEEWPLSAEEIATETENDTSLRTIKQYTLDKWPTSTSKSKESQIIPYYNTRHSLSVVHGCLLKDTQVIIPKNLQHRVLQLLHKSHLGTVKMKQLARSHCWWPTINKDIMELTRSCQTCAQLQPLPPREFKSWEEPNLTWSRVHVDFAGPIWNSKWLIIVDAKSKFPIVIDMKNDTTAKNLCNVLENVIDWFGPPEILVSDNGPPFNSYEMNKFYNKYGINHVTTPPYHPASNGIAERFVRSFKEAMLKQQQSEPTNKSTALRNVLRSYRWSPHTSTGRPPANMMLQHPIRTEFELMKPGKSTISQQETKYDVGDSVWALIYQHNKRPTWQLAIIKKNLGSMVYEITSSDGQHHKRHQNQLRPHYSTDNHSFVVDSLPDDLLNTQSQSTTLPSSPVSSPRYPRRIRKPPDRYTPS
jgi:transposase InsO family protein